MADDWHTYLLPKERDGERLLGVTPLALIEHTEGDDRRKLSKEFGYDPGTGSETVVYRVFSNLRYDENDPTQSHWQIDYGIECSLEDDMLTREFMNAPSNVSSPESYAESVADDIFPALERRTDQHYGIADGQKDN